MAGVVCAGIFLGLLVGGTYGQVFQFVEQVHFDLGIYKEWLKSEFRERRRLKNEVGGVGRLKKFVVLLRRIDIRLEKDIWWFTQASPKSNGAREN